jgi:hypothetical protein
MNKEKLKDIIIRALKTFIQGFLGALAITLPNSDLASESVLKSLLIGALASGISALMNFILNLMKGDTTE